MKKLIKLLNKQGQGSPTLSQHLLRLLLLLVTLGGVGSAWANYNVKDNGNGTSTITWDFAEYTKQVDLQYASDATESGVKTETYQGLTIVGGEKLSSGSASDYIKSTTGFHGNGTSSNTTSHITYTPEHNGRLTVTFKSNNNGDAANRYTAINTSISTATLSVNPKSISSWSNGTPISHAAASTGSVSAELTAGTNYYIYFAEGGQSITKLEYTYQNGSEPLSTDFSMTVKIPDSDVSSLPASLTTSNQLETLKGGTVSQNGLDSNAKGYGLKFGNNADYIAITLDGGKKIIQGSVITVSFETSNVASNGIRFGNTTNNSNASSNAIKKTVIGKFTDETYVVPAGSNLIGCSTFYVFRDGGNATYLTALSVSGCADAVASHTVTYANGDGTGTLPTQADVIEGGTFTVAAGTNLTKTGHTFAGWNDGTADYAAGATYTMGTSDVTLTAQWTPNTYHIKYRETNETTIDATPNTYTYGTTTILGTPVKEGYRFLGWYKDKGNLTGDPVTQVGPTEMGDVTVYAKWEVAGSSECEMLSATAGPSNTDESRRTYTGVKTGDQEWTVTIPYGDNGDVQDSKHYFYIGYTMSEKASGSGNIKKSLGENPGSKSSQDIVVTAEDGTTKKTWKVILLRGAVTHTVTYDLNDGTGTAPTQAAVAEEASFTVASADGITKENHTFAGWNDGSRTYAPGDAYTMGTSNVTLTAQWQEVGKTIGGSTTEWNTAHSDWVNLTSGDSYQFTFVNKNESSSKETYRTWCLLGYPDEQTTDAIVGTRPVGCNWINTNTNPNPVIAYEGTGASFDEYIKLLHAGSPTTVTVSYHNGKIHVSAVNVDEANSRKYTLTYSSNNVENNVYVRFTTDLNTLTNFKSQQLATPVTGVSLNKTSALVAVGGTESLSATVAPDGASYKDVVWTSSNTAVATVSSTGVVTAVAVGSADITVTTLDGLYTATCAVTVAQNCNYTAVAKCGDINLGTIASGTVPAGTTVPVAFKRYIFKDNVVYEKAAISNEYHQYCKVENDNQEFTVEYFKPTGMDNIVYVTEVEDIPSVTICEGGNIYSRASNGKAGYSEDYIKVTDLPAGKYEIAGNGVNSNSAVRYGSFKVGDTEVLATKMPQNNWYWFSCPEFVVTETSTLYFMTEGHSGSGLDYFFIRKTGDYTPANKVNITFETEDGQAAAVVSTPNYGVTASVAHGNMTTDGAALKMETSTAVTINIPEGYTATMTMKASNNGGIKVDDVSNPTTTTWTNLTAGSHTITKDNSLNVSMITIQLTPIHTEVAALTSVTSSAQDVEITPAGNNVWGVVVPHDYSGETVPVTLNYEHATSITVTQEGNAQTATSTGTGTATYDFSLGSQTEPVSYTVTVGSNEYTINVLKLGQEYEKKINVTDFNYYIGTAGISAENNGLDRDLNGVSFTFTGGQGVKANSESLITVRSRGGSDGVVTITLNGANSGKHITKVVLGGSGFTAEAANYLTMTDGHITYRNSSELMVVPTTQTNTITFQSNGTDVNITSFTIYTDAELSFTKVTPTINVGIPAQVVTSSTVTPTLTTTPKNFKVEWKLTSNGAKSTINVATGVIEVGKTVSVSNTARASFNGNAFYNSVNISANFSTVDLKISSIEASGFTEAVTEPSTSVTVTIESTPSDATVYYTTDGSDPTTSSTQGKSLTITQSTLVKAIAVTTVSGVQLVSEISSKSFNFKDPTLFNTLGVKSLSNITDLSNKTNKYLPDQTLKDGSGNDALVLSWGSYRLCSLNGSTYDPTKQGDSHTLKDEPAKVQNVDGFGKVIDAKNNPRAEDGSSFSQSDALSDDPLNLPVMGSFAKLQPLYNGTATVYILQNGATDWTYEKVDGKDVETYQLDKVRRRPTYVVDEFGTALSNGANGEPEVVHAELASNAVFETKTFNAIQLAVAGTDANAFDEDTKVSTISSGNGAANVAYWQNLIKNRGWAAGGNMPSSGANSALVRTEANGFELMIKQYVKYTFPVTAGRTYFVLGSGTNNGLAAVKFVRTNDDVATDATAVVIDEAATDFGTITDNVGKQVNVQLKREFTAGKWYSLVLPFSMNEKQVKQYFGDVAIYWFDKTDDEGNIFWKKHHYQMINAGIPVLMKVGQTFRGGTVIKNVLIQTDQIREYSYGGDYVMTGTWTKTTMPENCYYISNTESTNPDGKTYQATIYRTNKTTSTNGLRAWVRPTTSNAAKLTGISFSSFLDEDFDTATAIDEVLEAADEIVTPVLTNDALYNIGGQQMNAGSIRNLPKGIYIQNGRKFIK